MAFLLSSNLLRMFLRSSAPLNSFVSVPDFDVSDDEEDIDASCPFIRLTKVEKGRVIAPW
ncbi:hypothetical protein COLO4_06011 [Corchorus olitorius]|uniref:Uncharacterized protein n=1 Tax=Corchorus olitorius TaxID=93759 RepID=A0A1R3KP98_9ROSI|nr:hypothetical protein COLO4_06011 [Corchorus olitorius]